MGTRYGFRIFVVSAHLNRVKGNDALDVSEASKTRNEIVSILDTVQTNGTRYFQPRPPKHPLDPKRAVATMTVSAPEVVRRDLVHVLVGSGETGSHPIARQKGKTPRNLDKWSPEVNHFVTLLFPKTPGTKFLIVAQTANRRDPLKQFLRLIREESLGRMKAARLAEDIERARVREAGGRPAPRATHSRLVFDYAQASESQYIDEIMGSAKSASVTFKALVPSSRGRQGDVVERTLTIKLLDDRRRDVGRLLAKNWMGRKRSGGQPTAATGVLEAAGALTDDDLLDADEAHRYTDVAISVGNGEDSTTIAVNTLKDVFTYPVSDGQPSASHHYNKMAPRVRTVAREENIDVRKIDATEVTTWLEGSI
jgi:hypothetical protein